MNAREPKSALKTMSCSGTAFRAPMLLWWSSEDLLWAGGLGAAAEIAEDLARHEALEATDDLPLALPLSGAAPDVVEGRLVGAHPHHDHAMEGGVGLPVPAAVQPVPAGLAARGRDRAGTAEFGKGGFGADPLRVIADEDQHLRRGC